MSPGAKAATTFWSELISFSPSVCRRKTGPPMRHVSDWLDQLGMSEYAQRFAENRIDFSVLSDLTDQDLEKMGVILGDRRKMLRAIAGLKSGPAAVEPPAPAVAPTPATAPMKPTYIDAPFAKPVPPKLQASAAISR